MTGPSGDWPGPAPTWDQIADWLDYIYGHLGTGARRTYTALIDGVTDRLITLCVIRRRGQHASAIYVANVPLAGRAPVAAATRRLETVGWHLTSSWTTIDGKPTVDVQPVKP